MDGSQTFDLNGFGVTGYNIVVQCQFAKTADTVGTGSEADAWFSDTAVDRFVRFKSTSTIEAESAIPYSMLLDLPLRYYTRSDGEIGGNTTVTLEGHAFVESATLDGAFAATVVEHADGCRVRVVISVNIGPCTCPGEPHPDGDVLELREKLSLAQGLAVRGPAPVMARPAARRPSQRA